MARGGILGVRCGEILLISSSTLPGLGRVSAANVNKLTDFNTAVSSPVCDTHRTTLGPTDNHLLLQFSSDIPLWHVTVLAKAHFYPKIKGVEKLSPSLMVVLPWFWDCMKHSQSESQSIRHFSFLLSYKNDNTPTSLACLRGRLWASQMTCLMPVNGVGVLSFS